MGSLPAPWSLTVTKGGLAAKEYLLGKIPFYSSVLSCGVSLILPEWGRSTLRAVSRGWLSGLSAMSGERQRRSCPTDHLSPGFSWRILLGSAAQKVYNVAAFLRKEENLSVHGSHFSSHLLGWRCVENWSFNTYFSICWGLFNGITREKTCSSRKMEAAVTFLTHLWRNSRSPSKSIPL